MNCLLRSVDYVIEYESKQGKHSETFLRNPDHSNDGLVCIHANDKPHRMEPIQKKRSEPGQGQFRVECCLESGNIRAMVLLGYLKSET